MLMKPISTCILLLIVGMFVEFYSQCTQLMRLSPTPKKGEKETINLKFRKYSTKMLSASIGGYFLYAGLFFNEFKI